MVVRQDVKTFINNTITKQPNGTIWYTRSGNIILATFSDVSVTSDAQAALTYIPRIYSPRFQNQTFDLMTSRSEGLTVSYTVYTVMLSVETISFKSVYPVVVTGSISYITDAP
jgi:hypothetical protein